MDFLCRIIHHCLLSHFYSTRNNKETHKETNACKKGAYLACRIYVQPNVSFVFTDQDIYHINHVKARSSVKEVVEKNKLRE